MTIIIIYYQLLFKYVKYVKLKKKLTYLKNLKDFE